MPLHYKKLLLSERRLVDLLRQGLRLRRAKFGSKYNIVDLSKPYHQQVIKTFHARTISNAIEKGILKIGVQGCVSTYVVDEENITDGT